MTVDRIACLDKFVALRKAGYEQAQAINKVVYEYAGLDYDNDEDDICNLQAFLSLNDPIEADWA
jgi:hypothetical protein